MFNKNIKATRKKTRAPYIKRYVQKTDTKEIR